MQLEKCPNCTKSLKGVFGSDLLPQSRIDFINKHLGTSAEYYCTSCSKTPLNKIANILGKQKVEIETRLEQIINYLPIITGPAPIKWEYEVIGMITAQTTSGTGALTEFAQSFSDFFGMNSERSNRKIDAATKLGTASLRLKCLKAGGNAIIATDIDFNEIGTGNTHMLMVCLAGTAIKVLDMNNFNPKTRDFIIEITELTEQLMAITEATR